MAQKNPLHPIPSPAGRPFIGNMLTLDSDTPLQSLMQVTRDMGPIFWLNMMGTPLVVASGAALVDELCDEKRFDKAVRGSLRRVRSIAGDGLFTGDTQEPNWGKAHNILLPTFSQRAMVDYLPMMLDIADQLVLKWERLNADDEIDVVHDMTALALDTIGVCGFDYRFNSFYRRDYHPFIDALTRTLETCMKQRGLPFEDVLLKKRLDQLRTDVDFMNRLVDDIIRERRRGGATAQAPKDLLNYMLAGVDKTTGESLSDENIRYQINTFLIAGHETTSGLLSFTLYFLLNNRDVLERAYEEADRVLGADLDARPTYQQVNQLVYIQQILKEALRLWPTAPAFGLYPYRDETIGGQFNLKARTFVTVLTLMLHRDASVWGPDPETFNPDNFSREAEAARPVNAYKPFGNGQRACIGRQFAMQEATLVLGMILQRFQLFDHKNYQLKIKETLSIKPDGFTIKVRPRPNRMRGLVVAGARLANGASATSAEMARRPKHGAQLAVLYGSNLGATEEMARRIAESGEVNGFAVTLATLDEFAGKLPKAGAVVIACPSYNGGPPDNAGRFLAELERAPQGACVGVDYAMFGSGNRDWASTFQTIPRQIDEKLAALGARRIGERGEGDAREDMDTQFQRWTRKLWPKIGRRLALEVDFSDSGKSEPLFQVEVAPNPATTPVVMHAGATAMRVLVNRELQNRAGAKPSERSTRHVEVALPAGVSYRPGDHLSVVPSNGEDMVKRAQARFGFDADTHIRLATTGGRRNPYPVEGATPVARLLRDMVELQHVATRTQIAILAEHTRCPVTRPKLAALAAEPDRYRAEVSAKRKSVLDLLEEFPACEAPFGVYLEMLTPLAPRYYSISSSPIADLGRCAVTVGVVEGPARSGRGVYRGACSNHLAATPESGTILASLRETKAGFRLPDDPAIPIVMVGPGTGLAPFRGFLRERAARKAQGAALGAAMLFFGCRHPDQDFIYADELKGFERDGLTSLHVAFSRGDGEKTYVQDLVKRQGAEVWRLIEAGAVVYVCGDGSRMEPDVKRALVTLCREKRNTDWPTAEAWMEELSRQNRYVLDVWAGN